MTHDTRDDELVMLAAYPLYHNQAARIDAALDGGHISEREALYERQRLFGICSERDCEQPIAGYHGTGPKLCLLHLGGHLTRIEQQKGAAADPAELALLQAAEDELRAHLVDDGTLAVPHCESCGAELNAYEQDMEYTQCYACDEVMNKTYFQEGGGDGA